MTAWQKQIRDQRARDSSDADLFGNWWEKIDTSLKSAEVRAISQATAETVIVKYEWLGTMPAVVLHCFGIYFQGHLGGVTVFSPEYGENLGIWDKYGFSDRIICLSRGACAHWTPRNTASLLIRKSMKMLPGKYGVVTATCDAEAGEIGTIYQACGFDFVGQMSTGGKRTSFLSDGKLRSGRHAVRIFGSRGATEMAKRGAVGVKSHARKTRYFCFRGSVTARRKDRASIADLIKPYPKRSAACPPDERDPSRVSLVQPQEAAPLPPEGGAAA